MTKVGQLWTDSVAYVALFAGAGLSVAGNVANVLRTRGDAVDTLDIALAVAFPALVVLMVEVFVSSRWRGLGWQMQTLRWLGTLAIGGVAMRVSWVHLHALMLSRGQEADVAILGPLAIDFLAIMATALILAGRGRVQVAGVQDTSLAMEDITTDTLPGGTVVDIANGQIVGVGRTLATEDMAESEDSMWARLEREMSKDSPTPPVPVVLPEAPVSPAPARTMQDRLGGPRPRGQVNDGQARMLAEVGKAHGLGAGYISELLGGHYGVSSRTIRRQPWWTTAMAGVDA
jgi:hypothetical protein